MVAYTARGGIGGSARPITTVCGVLQYLEMGYPPRLGTPMKLLRTPTYRQLRKLLATARQHASLTQPQLAERVSASQGFVAKYQSGKGPSRRR